MHRNLYGQTGPARFSEYMFSTDVPLFLGVTSLLQPMYQTRREVVISLKKSTIENPQELIVYEELPCSAHKCCRLTVILTLTRTIHPISLFLQRVLNS